MTTTAADPTYIYVDSKKSPTGWYEWDFDDNQARPLDSRYLGGTVVGVAVHERKFREEVNQKLRVRLAVESGELVVEVGLRTRFANTLLAALAQMTTVDLERPITIGIKFVEGVAEAVVFAAPLEVDIADLAPADAVTTLQGRLMDRRVACGF